MVQVVAVENLFFAQGNNMIVASWNVNSITVRLESVLKWLNIAQPDILCLQETKSVDNKFPALAFQQVGYHSEFIGQPSYNGVAILSKLPLTDVEKHFEPEEVPSQKRFIKADYQGSTIINTYIPNGQALGSEKFSYKIDFLNTFERYLSAKYKPSQPIIWCGDFNIAPEGIDTFDIAQTDGQIMCSEQERALLERIKSWGFTDTFRQHNKEPGQFSWWDYRVGAFRRNLGYRIDHIWATETLSKTCNQSWIDIEPRKWERPSDHAPVLATFRTI